MTKGQELDLETIRFFIPECMKHLEITDQDVKDFFELSEQGKHQGRIGLSTMDGLNALAQGKRWRGIHMEMWEEGVLSGDVPYATLLEDLPRSVVEFMAKEMFKGADRELIMRLADSV
jgi:hypothetical protein